MVRWEDRDDGRWIHVAGELDYEGCARVEDQFRKCAMGGAKPVVVVDLEGVSFIASQGLRMLLQVHHALKEVSRSLHVRGCRPHVRRVLETTGILHAIPEWPS